MAETALTWVLAAIEAFFVCWAVTVLLRRYGRRGR